MVQAIWNLELRDNNKKEEEEVNRKMRLDTQGLLIRSQGSTYKKSAHLNNVYLIRRQEEEERMNLRACLRSTKIFNAIFSPIFSALLELRVFILSSAMMSLSHY